MVEGEDATTLTTDYYGELTKIFLVEFPRYGRFTLVEGDWYQEVVPNNVTKTFNTNPNNRLPKNKYADMKKITGQIYVVNHPTEINTCVIFDRTADYLECEERVDPTFQEGVTVHAIRQEPMPEPEPEPVRDPDLPEEFDDHIDNDDDDIDNNRLDDPIFEA